MAKPEKQRPPAENREKGRKQQPASPAGRDKRGREIKIPSEGPRPGRTVGGEATSYTSVGGTEAPEEWAQRVPQPDDNAPDYETPGGAGETEGVSPVHDIAFRPAPGGYIEEEGEQGKDIPYSGEAVSTRGASFEENPETGQTPEEEREALLSETLEKRSRRHESG